MKQVKIVALEPDELQLVSAYMQDAIIKIGDISYLSDKQKFVLLANRFERENLEGAKPGAGFRIRCGLVFSRVESVRTRKIRQGANDAVLSLLSMEFEAGEAAPQGCVVMMFSGGGEIRLDVECVEVQMEDLGEHWPTKNIPAHDDEV